MTGKANNYFGSSYDQYKKTVVAEGRNHYYGKGPACDLGNEGTDLKLTKRRANNVAKQTRDRGLLIDKKMWKEQKLS